MQAEYEMQQQQLAELQERLPLADAERRKQRDAVQELGRQLAQSEARLNALQQLQAQLDNDKNLKAWLARHQLDGAPRLWQSIRIEQGWEDALEAVLRERINALALPRLEDAAGWSDAPPAKLAVYAADGAHSNRTAVQSGLTPLANYVRCQDAQAAPVVEDWLAGVYAVSNLNEALSQRNNLPAGAWLVTAQGHLVGAHSVLFHAPDSQLHGVLARQREIEAFAGGSAAAQRSAGAGQAAVRTGRRGLPLRRGAHRALAQFHQRSATAPARRCRCRY